MLLRRPSATTLIALLALFVALGGSSYAALQLPTASVGTKQLKKNAVTSPKVKPGSLLLSDFRRSQRSQLRGARGPQGGQGPAGTPGASGPPGEPGSALAFAHILVSAGGATVDPQRSKGIAQANVNRGGMGVVCFRGLGFTPRNGTANGDAVQNPAVVANVGIAPDAAVLAICGSDAQAAIAIQEVADPPTNTDHDIYVSFN